MTWWRALINAILAWGAYRQGAAAQRAADQMETKTEAVDALETRAKVDDQIARDDDAAVRSELREWAKPDS